MKPERRWKIYGVLYFTLVFGLVPSLALAYIDPSVTTYAIQAIAGVAVAMGAFFATYGRRMKKKLSTSLGMDESGEKEKDPPLEVYREDLKQELEARRRAAEAEAVRNQESGKRKGKIRLKGRILPSVLCGLAFALAIELRPIITFYLNNEGEFWFRLSDIILQVLVLFACLAGFVALLHFLLPEKKFNWRLLFAALVGVITLGSFIQNHFMSAYLPLLTGDLIDWSLYPGWNLASIGLWGGLTVIFLVLLFLKPLWLKGILYSFFALIICAETVSGGIDLVTAKHENQQENTYFSRQGMYETPVTLS